MGISLIAGVATVTLPNIFHAALALVGALLGIAGIYVILHAEFLAVIQVLLYVGAVVTLIIFAIMLTHRLGDRAIPQKNNQSLPAGAALAAFVALISSLILKIDWHTTAGAETAPLQTVDLGKALLGVYVFPFEVVSIVLIAALVGAVSCGVDSGGEASGGVSVKTPARC